MRTSSNENKNSISLVPELLSLSIAVYIDITILLLEFFPPEQPLFLPPPYKKSPLIQKGSRYFLREYTSPPYIVSFRSSVLYSFNNEHSSYEQSIWFLIYNFFLYTDLGSFISEIFLCKG